MRLQSNYGNGSPGTWAPTVGEVAVGLVSVGVLQQTITGLCYAGDEVLLVWHSSEAYPILVELAGAWPVVPVACHGGGVV